MQELTLLMRRSRRVLGSAGATLMILSLALPARSQTKQVWPEVSTFIKLNDIVRFYFLATTVKENRESTEGEFGPNIDFYVKPLKKQKK